MSNHLRRLREAERKRAKRGKRFNKKLTLWFYCRIQFCIDYEAKERGLRAVRVSPKGTSSKCPKCNSKLADNSYRILRCSKCNFIGDRDVVATINLYKKLTRKILKMWGPGSPRMPPSRCKPKKR
uniref:Cas12f1-like TNB domain-containing protein n=1 Tax=Ignisphaera aggregans TaxID=334771 RepID=A0A7C5TKQ0_9CREN